MQVYLEKENCDSDIIKKGWDIMKTNHLKMW